MKKILFRLMLCIALFSIFSCTESQEQNTHTHSDGSKHSYHDTVKPVQEQFKVTDNPLTAPVEIEHTHKDGKPHSH